MRFRVLGFGRPATQRQHMLCEMAPDTGGCGGFPRPPLPSPTPLQLRECIDQDHLGGSAGSFLVIARILYVSLFLAGNEGIRALYIPFKGLLT